MNRRQLLSVGLILIAASTSHNSSDASALEPAETWTAVTYPNPLVEQRADPWILKHDDGYYYFIASVPEYDRIELRRARTVAELAEAEAKAVWTRHESGPMSWHIWAPELHHIDGTWYIYFAAGMAESPWNIRMWALSSDAENPLDGEWTERGRMHTDLDTFSLDATTFEHRGRRYLIWAQNEPDFDTGTTLRMAEMSDPVTVKQPIITISRPELPWERIGHNVNEGAAVLKRDGRIFVTYSASATDENYAIGLLWAAEDADLLDPASWNKAPEPVFKTSEANGEYGPGHNSFTIAEDGETVLMVYHARPYAGTRPDPLSDPNRHARVKAIEWDEDGMPVFGQPGDQAAEAATN